MIALVEGGGAWPALVHAGEVLFHALGGEHVDVLEAERLEDVGLEEVIEGCACYALGVDAGPVDVGL